MSTVTDAQQIAEQANHNCDYCMTDTCEHAEASRATLAALIARALTEATATAEAELDAYRKAMGYRDPEEAALKDRGKTHEINILTTENRSLRAQLTEARRQVWEEAANEIDALEPLDESLIALVDRLRQRAQPQTEAR